MNIDDVREYYSNTFDLLRIHKRKFFYTRELYRIKEEFSINNKDIYHDDVNILNKKLYYNKICSLYLTKLLDLCNTNNYINIYEVGNEIVNMYDTNISYLDAEIKSNKLLCNGICYNSNLNYIENFNEVVEDKYNNIKIKK